MPRPDAAQRQWGEIEEELSVSVSASASVSVSVCVCVSVCICVCAWDKAKGYRSAASEAGGGKQTSMLAHY